MENITIKLVKAGDLLAPATFLSSGLLPRKIHWTSHVWTGTEVPWLVTRGGEGGKYLSTSRVDVKMVSIDLFPKEMACQSLQLLFRKDNDMGQRKRLEKISFSNLLSEKTWLFLAEKWWHLLSIPVIEGLSWPYPFANPHTSQSQVRACMSRAQQESSRRRRRTGGFRKQFVLCFYRSRFFSLQPGAL